MYKRNLREWAKDRMELFEDRLTSLVKRYSELESKEHNNEIKRKWLNLCNENYAIQRRMITDYLSGESIDEVLGDMEYQIQVGAREYPLFIRFVNSAEYIFELLYLNSVKLQQKLIVKKERSFVSDYRKAFKELGIMSDKDKEVHENIWSIRNAMHRNNYPRNNIELDIKDYETGITMHYKVDKGHAIYSPDEGIDKITEIISEIMLIIIDGIDDLKLSNIKDIA